MKKKLPFVLLTVLLLIIFQTSYPQSNFSILPQPREIKELKTVFQLFPETKITYKNLPDSTAAGVASVLNHALRLRGKSEIGISGHPAQNSLAHIHLHFSEKIPTIQTAKGKVRIKWHKQMDAEGYVLLVRSEKIDIYARTPRGLYYGALTLRQLFRFYGGRVLVPGVIIRDWPKLKMRGITEDISRGQVPTLATFKKQIQFLSECKMNTYMLYLEDMFVFEKYPEIGRDRGALTPAEVTELQVFAQRHHVEVIPIFQTLGHCENILIQPEFSQLAEFPGATTLNCTSPQTLNFMENIFREIAPVFKSDYFHIGGDECWDVGKGANKVIRRQWGMSYLLGNYFNRIYSLAQKYRKRVIIYGDMLVYYPELLKRLPKDIIILDWQYHNSKEYRSIKLFKKSGKKFIVSPGLSNWRRIYPNYHDSFFNIKKFIREGQKASALGAVVASWGDYGGENLHELNWYGFAFAAECAWNNHKITTKDYNSKFFQNYYGNYVPELDSAYYHLAEIGAIADVADFWRYPFRTEQPSQHLLEQIHKLQFHSHRVLKLIPTLSRKVRYHQNHLQYLLFIARRGLLHGRKLQYAQEINLLCRQLAHEPENQRIKSTIIAMCSAMIHELQQLQAQYQHLWLLTNKRENLQNILELYHRQIFFWEKKIEQVRAGKCLFNGELTSQWIYHPAVEVDSAAKYHVQFEKRVYLPADLKKFSFQTIGQSFVKIYFNGHLIGEQAARRSVSLIVEKQRVRIWDVTPFVTEGHNKLVLEVKNYDRSEAASINFYGEIVCSNGKIIQLLSDSSWNVTTHFIATGNGSKSDFRKVLCLPSKYFITQPDLQKGLSSSIEWR